MSGKSSERRGETVPERCLNCGEQVVGAYCPACGQKTAERRVSIRTFLGEFFDDFFTLDSKILKSFAFLVVKPGLLTREYNEGRRARYVRPLRLYLLLSLVYFFTLSLKDPDIFRPAALISPEETSAADTSDTTSGVPVIVGDLPDSLLEDVLDRAGIRGVLEEPEGEKSKPGVFTLGPFEGVSGFEATIDTSAGIITGMVGVDSILALIDTTEMDSSASYIERQFASFVVDRFTRFRGMSIKEFAEVMMAGFRDNLPRMMFMLLPVFALILKVFYFRRKRFYVEHLIFSLHFHAFAFLVLLCQLLVGGETYGDLAAGILLLYLFLALRTVYRQSVGKTILKVFLLTFSYSIVLGLGFVATILFTAAVV